MLDFIEIDVKDVNWNEMAWVYVHTDWAFVLVAENFQALFPK
jgi:hypothetical protein